MNVILKKGISCLLAALMVFGLFTGLVPIALAEDACGYTPAMTAAELNDSGEDAVSGSSYSISTRDELLSFMSYVSSGKPTEGATFYLTDDIKFNDDDAWTPVGTADNNFEGVFDGCGFAVLGFDNKEAGNNYALFGCISGSGTVVKNLGVEGELTGISGIGGIAYSLSGGAKIENCWSAVDITCDTLAGGIAAEVSSGTISNCLSYGYISGEGTGAIAGSVTGGAVIEYSYYVYYGADAAVGSSADSSVDVYRFASSSTEALTEKELTVGSVRSDDLISLLNAWIDMVSGVDEYRQWVYDTSDSSTSRTDGRYPSMIFPGYIIAEDSIYTATASMTALYESGKSGEDGAYYSISTAQELQYFRDYVNNGLMTDGVTFFVTADINMATISAMTQDQQWVPIGSTESTAFQGVFDAQGYVLADNVITSGSGTGLFGYVDGTDAEIKNVAATGVISASDEVGGIVGYLINGSVMNCWFDGEINASDRVGGIVGKAEGGTIANCVSFATVVADSKSGGIVGQTSSAVSVKYCYYPTSDELGVGSGNATQTAVVGYTKDGSDFTLDRSITVGSASGIKLLNVLNHWVNYLAVDSSYREWKIDSSAAGIARLQGEHPTQLFPGDGSGSKNVDEPHVDVDDTTNPYSVEYTATATMTELYESGEAAVSGGQYSISSGSELELLASFVNAANDTKDVTFYLTEDVDISVNALGNEGDGWTPIGMDFTVENLTSLLSTFRGTFDGCGYTVTGLYMTNEKGDCLGLFGRVYGGTIKNLGVVGGMVGEIMCGGIVGRIDNGTIENCWTAVSIQSESQTGGIAGRIDDTVIRNCVSYGAMLAYGGVSAVAGGIFGDDHGGSTVTNCYYLDGSTTAAYNSVDSSSTVDIISFTYGFENDDYYCTLARAAQIDDVTTTSLLDALNAWAKVQNNGLYSGWVNSAVLIVDGNGVSSGHYPRLMEPSNSSSSTEYSGDYTATSTMSALYSTRTDGIKGAYYSINGLDDLEALQSYVADGYETKNITFFMTRDIDMSEKYSAGTDRSWSPIGDSSEPFQGIFDGQGYTVKYLYINTSADDVGLFGYVNGGATIKNLGVCGVVRGNTNAAGIVGDFNFSTIANCWVSCEVTALDNNAGGLVGSANMGSILNCTNYGVVANAAQYGAIAGYAFGTTMKYCYYLYATCQQAYGELSSTNDTGVMYFNGTSAACILDEKVDVEGTTTRNALSALKLYVDAHPETNYCYWTTGSNLEYAEMGVTGFPVLISASNTMGEKDYNEIQAYFNNEAYYSVVKAVNAANDSENGGDVTLALNAVLSTNEDLSLDDNVRLVTGDYSLVIKSEVKLTSMQQLNGMFIVKDGGSILLADDTSDDGYRLFMYASKNADPSCNSEFYGVSSLTFFSYEVKSGDTDAYNLSLHDGEFIVNSTLDSGNPHKIPGGSTLTIEEGATLNVLANARIRTTGGAEIYNNGTIKIGNATLDCNGGELVKGVLEDSDGTVSLPFVYKDGYTLRGWSDGETLYAAGGTADASEAVTLTAQWRIGDSSDPYPGDDAYTDSDEPIYNIPITVIQSGGGTITPDSMMAAKGENLSFAFSADSGYYIKNVLVDLESAELDDNSAYSFVSISRQHTLLALYAKTTNTAYYNWQNPFTDVSSDAWYYDNVRYCSSAELFNGTPNNTFSPDMVMTREMFITVLWRLSGSPIVPGSGIAFTDVPSDSYAYEAIRWGKYCGIVNGTSDTTFGYGQAVTREQLVTFLFRYSGQYAGDDVSQYDNTNILIYADFMSISKGMTQPFQWAIGAGIVNGVTETVDGESTNYLKPQGEATRAEVAAMLSRYCSKFINTVPVLNVD